jgi:acyl-CoA synthetase (AMP-forming)/AMP-acid ligase II
MWSFADVLDEVAVSVPAGAEAFRHGERVILWHDARRRMEGLAGFLHDAGLRPGDKVAFYMRNGPAYGELAGACFLGGFVHVNVNYRYKPHEVAYILQNADAAAVVYTAEFREAVAEIFGQLPTLKVALEVGARAGRPDFARDYEGAAESGLPIAQSAPRSPDNQVFVYTGGTTGMPKGVMQRQGDLVPALMLSAELFPGQSPRSLGDIGNAIRARGSAAQRYLPACPQMHGTGFFVTMATLLSGGCLVTVERSGLDAAHIWQTVEQHGVTDIAIVGDAFARPMLSALREASTPPDLSSLASIASSGTIWSVEVRTELLSLLPDLRLLDFFASSEATTMGVAVSTAGNVAPTACFIPTPNVIIIDDEDRPIPPGSGAAGRIAIGGAQPLGYYKDSGKSAATFKMIDGQRYSIPGDYARVEPDGTLVLLGRGSHCINTAGEKVFPEEVEEALKLHGVVEDALVVGVPDEKWGQAVVGIVTLASGSVLDEVALRRHVRETLAAYKVPKRIFATEANLRAPNGKADYAAARNVAGLALG